MEKTLTTQQIADDLNAWVGTIRAAALRVFPRSEMVYDMDRKGFIFTEEQAERIKAEFTKGEDKKEKVLIGNERKDLTVKEELIQEKNQPIAFESFTDKDGVQFISARELHEKLEISERFASWFDRVCAYGFVENADYLGCKVFNTLAKQELQDYKITVEMAKQICMLQRSDKGKLYREYFLKLERAWNTPEAVMARALQVANRTLEDAKKKIDLQQQQIEEMKPDADSWNTYAGNLEERNSEKSFRDVAKLLQIDPQHRLCDFLESKKYIYRNGGDKHKRWTASQEGLQSGVVVNRTINSGAFSGEQCKITTFGMKKLAEWKEQGAFEGCLIKKREENKCVQSTK